MKKIFTIVIVLLLHTSDGWGQNLVGGVGDGAIRASVYTFVNGTKARFYRGENGDGFGFAGFNGNIPFPVTLLSFDGVVVDNQVELIWTTTNEVNNHGFTVERSLDGELFHPLEFVDADTERVDIHIYKTIDRNPLSGRSYYRLKQEDIDGGFSYSATISVWFESRHEFDFEIFPNPLSGRELNIILKGKSASKAIEWQVLDLMGKSIQSRMLDSASGSHSFVLQFDHKISPGIYLIHLKSDGLEDAFKVLLIE